MRMLVQPWAPATFLVYPTAALLVFIGHVEVKTNSQLSGPVC